MISFLCPKIIVKCQENWIPQLPVRKGKTQLRAMRMVIQPCAQPSNLHPQSHLSACRRRYNEIVNTKKRVKRNPNQTVR